jgi:hypothetical protein
MRIGIELLILAALALLGTLLIDWVKPAKTIYRTEHKTDTVYLPEQIPTPTVSNPITPKKVVLQPQDSVRRAEAEQGTILRGIQFKKDKLEIHSISSKGISQVAEYPELPCSLPISIDHAGNLGIDSKELKRIQRKEKLRRMGNKLLIAGSFVAGILLASAVGQ